MDIFQSDINGPSNGNIVMIVVTGANGFIGGALCAELAKRDLEVLGTVRNLNSLSSQKIAFSSVVSGDINSETPWENIFSSFAQSSNKKIDCLIHCAGLAHVVEKPTSSSFAPYNSVNVDGTARLVRFAVKAGIRRLIFLSSTRVYGDRNRSQPVTYLDDVAPGDIYGSSKLAGEQLVTSFGKASGVEVVIVRLPLVYGPGVKGNLLRLLRLVQSGYPLPFGAINNQRSLLGLDNLTDFLIHCITTKSAAGKTFLVSDGRNFSTPELIYKIAARMGTTTHLIPIPVFCLRAAGHFSGRITEVNRLVNSFMVDITHTVNALDWRPAVSVETGIKNMVTEFLRR